MVEAKHSWKGRSALTAANAKDVRLDLGVKCQTIIPLDRDRAALRVERPGKVQQLAEVIRRRGLGSIRLVPVDNASTV